MSALLLAITGWDAAPWERRFRAAAPGRDIRLWPDRVGDPADIAYAAAWLPQNAREQKRSTMAGEHSSGVQLDRQEL